mgnify:CR=1|jgi:hypothetical protein|tara:strand:- start:189 stop:323 length:135 start_codon:yes stop_codon:yes gene_type:complete
MTDFEKRMVEIEERKAIAFEKMAKDIRHLREQIDRAIEEERKGK